MSVHLAAAILVVLSADPVQKPERYARPEMLLEAGELVRPAATRQLRILDTRPREKYAAGHIPGAVWVDQATWSKAFAVAPDALAWSKRLGILGIDTSTSVVIYDDNSAKDAARVWWILRYWGLRDVRLLNGGWKAWQDSGKTVTEDVPRVPAAQPRLVPQAGRLATKGQLLEELKRKEWQIIDARSEGEFCGTEKTAQRNGAIPGAIHQEWSDVIDRKTQRFKNPSQLAALLRANHIDPDRPTVTYCQSGGRASVAAFALELMGVKEVRNYYRSWAEWGNAEDTPVVQPQKK
jgi:thiosulfate/3-mercaptopyruvate sulfurtransferase